MDVYDLYDLGIFLWVYTTIVFIAILVTCFLIRTNKTRKKARELERLISGLCHSYS